MTVQVRLFGTLRQHLPDVRAGQWYAATLPENATVGELLAALGVPIDDTKQAFVNDVAVEFTHALHEGDQVGVFPPVSGGALDWRRTRASSPSTSAPARRTFYSTRQARRSRTASSLILPSPTVVLARQVRAVTAARRPLWLGGHLMGGGALVWAVREHLSAGLRPTRRPPPR